MAFVFLYNTSELYTARVKPPSPSCTIYQTAFASFLTVSGILDNLILLVLLAFPFSAKNNSVQLAAPVLFAIKIYKV